MERGHRRPNVLILTANANTLRSFCLSPEEILVSPAVTPTVDRGKVRAIAHPGPVDVTALVASFPEDQKPDLVVVLGAPEVGQYARNLKGLSCRKALFSSDTHHGYRPGFAPLVNMVDYALEEGFDVVLSAYNRHHLPWFYALGVPRVLFAPFFGHASRVHSPFRALEGKVAFIGQTGPHHPSRNLRLDRCARTLGEDFSVYNTLGQVDPEGAAAVLYNSHAVSLNFACNNDLTWRNVEILSAGGVLLTEELPAGQGLSDLLPVGEVALTFTTPEDAAEKARWLLAHEVERQALRLRGHRYYLDHFTPERIGQDLIERIMGKEKEDIAKLPFSGASARAALTLFEALSEWHWRQAEPIIALDPELPAALKGLSGMFNRGRFVELTPDAPVLPWSGLFCRQRNQDALRLRVGDVPTLSVA